MTAFDLSRRLAGEAIGTAFLLATVVGSGIMGDALSGGNTAIALLGNTIATGAILAVLILLFGPISGAHFNPAVTLAFWLRGEICAKDSVAYVIVQIAAGLVGVAIAHIMFEHAVVQFSTTARTGVSQWVAEFVAAFGLVATILFCLRAQPKAVPYAVGLFITAGYWFTSSTSFANPAVTIARAFTDTFSGIRPIDAPGFVVAQLIGAAVAAGTLAWFYRKASKTVTAPERGSTAAR